MIEMDDYKKWPRGVGKWITDSRVTYNTKNVIYKNKLIQFNGAFSGFIYI